MYYGIGQWQEVPTGAISRDNAAVWWERLCGPQGNVHACARALGKYLVRSTPTNPRSGYAMQAFAIVLDSELPTYGLPAPDSAYAQVVMDTDEVGA